MDPDSPLFKETSEGCPEFQVGAEIDQNLDVDPSVRSFMQAAADFAQIADDLHLAVYESCARVATDLGANDTWSAIEDLNERTTNPQGTGACDAAAREAEDVLVQAGTVNAQVALAVSRGECHLDFEAQAKCDAACAVNAPCDPGKIETRCEPGSLSVLCQAQCSAEATCVGRPDAPANCSGTCEATCLGQCEGTCFHADGRVTENDPSCTGKCTSVCQGTCTGQCQLAQATTCGSNVRCTGGCTSTFTEPFCTDELLPPNCELNQQCHAACSAEVAANAVCDPTLIEVFVNVQNDPTLAPLVETLKANVPPLWEVARAKGQLALEAAHRLGEAGEQIAPSIEELSGKSLVCLSDSSQAVANAISKLDVSVQASLRVVVTFEDGTK